jgi:hypothetical protein
VSRAPAAALADGTRIGQDRPMSIVFFPLRDVTGLVGGFACARLNNRNRNNNRSRGQAGD